MAHSEYQKLEQCTRASAEGKMKGPLEDTSGPMEPQLVDMLDSHLR